MQLENCFFRRTRCNSLFSAVHGQHGLAWTDSRCVYLSPVGDTNSHLQGAEPTKLGEFSDVDHVYWSSDLAMTPNSSRDLQMTSADPDGTCCFLCVVHKDTVTLWKVADRGRGQGVKGLDVRQVRKIHATPVPQGCLWHPTKDLLCLLTRDKVTFYFNHTLNKGNYAMPAPNRGHVTCGCWSEDGNSLVVGVGSHIVVYAWSDIDRSISEFTTVEWAIPGVCGRVCTLTTHTDRQFLCTVELPLDSVCIKQENLFHIPDLNIFATDSLTKSEISATSDQVTDLDQSEEEDSDHLETVSLSTEDTHSNHSHTQTLLNLKQTVPEQESSQLVLFAITPSANAGLQLRKLAGCNVPAILSPDLLYCQSGSNTVIVGSNSQSLLYVFSISEKTLIQTHVLNLCEHERPIGLCGSLATAGALVMVTKAERGNRGDVTFLPKSVYTHCDVIVKCLHVPGESVRTYVQNPRELPNTRMFREIQLPNGSSKVHLLRISPLRNQPDSGITMLDASGVQADRSNGNQAKPKHKELKSNEKAEKNKSQKVCSGMSGNQNQQSDSDSGSRTSSSCSGRSESPEFKLVLPNSSELILHNDHVTAPKIAVISNGGREAKTELDAETERTSFEQKTVRFKNKVKKFFEGGKSPPSERITTQTETADVDHQEIAQAYIRRFHSLTSTETSADSTLRSRSGRDYELRRDYESETTGLGPQELYSLLKAQREEISALHSTLDHMTRALETVNLRSSNQPTTFPNLTDAQTVTIAYHHLIATQNALETKVPCLEDGDCERSERNWGKCVCEKVFVLDRNRLKLDVVKGAFGLSTLEMSIGGVYCTVGCDAEGYIPLTIDAGTTLCVTGLKQECS